MNIWLYGLLVTIVGMVIVFVGLLLLIAIINVQAGAFRGTGLRVKSIRRVGSNAPAWNAAGRREYLGSRY